MFMQLCSAVSYCHRVGVVHRYTREHTFIVQWFSYLKSTYYFCNHYATMQSRVRFEVITHSLLMCLLSVLAGISSVPRFYLTPSPTSNCQVDMMVVTLVGGLRLLPFITMSFSLFVMLSLFMRNITLSGDMAISIIIFSEFMLSKYYHTTIDKYDILFIRFPK